MIRFLIGPESSFTTWCEEFLLAAMRLRPEGAEVIRANTARDLAVGLLHLEDKSILVVLRQAPAALYPALRDSCRKFVLASDEPTSCLFELIQKNGNDLASAVREIASGIVNLPHYMSLPNALVLQPCVKERELAEIARHLSLPSLSETASVPPPRPINQASRWRKSLRTEDTAMIVGALGPFLDSKSDSLFNWTSGLFWRNGDRPTAIDGPVDITGRARCLFEGPAISVALGIWRLSLRLGFSETALGNAFRIEVSAGTILGTRDVTPQQTGEVEINFDIKISEDSTGPLIIRMILLRAAFDGTITLAGACLAPLSGKI